MIKITGNKKVCPFQGITVPTGGSRAILWLLVSVALQGTPCTNIPLRSSKDAEERVFAPPTFPYWGPFGLTSTALFCPWFVGPFGGSWNRACAGPVPPFQPTTTSKPTPAPAHQNSTENYNFPNPFPPPVLRVPYDHSFYPLPNGLAIMAQRQYGRHQQPQRLQPQQGYLEEDAK